MADEINDGGPAYPSQWDDKDNEGMSLRDAAALAALPAIIQVCAGDSPREIGTETHEQMFARKAWAVADAFIAAREGKTNE